MEDLKSHTINELESELPGGPSDTKTPGESPMLEELQSIVEAKTQEATAAQEKYLRLAAEFENYKRIAQRDQRDAFKFANEQILKDILPAIDNLERAVQCAKDSKDVSAVIQGVQLTLKNFTETLARFDVRAVHSIGNLFDPACHQAVAQTESQTVPPNTVLEEHQKGYYLHDRILRAAIVTVSTDSQAGGSPSES